jgi:hypothetical protein
MDSFAVTLGRFTTAAGLRASAPAESASPGPSVRCHEAGQSCRHCSVESCEEAGRVMVAKSHPRRRTPSTGVVALEPSAWPDWVLDFGKGYFPGDPVRQAVRMAEFRVWMRERAAWFAEHGIEGWVHECSDERRHRAAAWQADHPEDVGPTPRRDRKA